MKNFALALACLLLTGFSQTVLAQSSVNKQSDTLLSNAQVKIYNAFIRSMMSQQVTDLASLGTSMEQYSVQRPSSLLQYWRAYLQYYASIYYLKIGDKKMAETEVDKGIDWLKDVKQKTSEDYALLALLQGFTIQFKGMKAMFLSGEIKKNAQHAIKLDSMNLRAYYVFGSNDFYTPTKYGGGKLAEQYLLKAVSLPAQQVENKYLPSWGKEEAYELLIKHYIKLEKWDAAKKFYRQGLDLFPQSYQINQLGAKLVDK